MQTAPNRSVEPLRDAVTSYVGEMAIPALDERAIAARRGTAALAGTRRRPLLQTAALAAAAALAAFLAVDASAVVAEMQRVFAAFALVGGRTVPMSVHDVDLAKARADVPFEIVAPPALAGTTLTLREMLSSASPASDTVVFNLDVRRSGVEVSIVETRDGGGARQVYLSEREPDRGDARVAPLPALPKLPSSGGTHIAVVGNLGNASFVPLTWVTRGTRIVLMSPPGALSDAQIRALRSAMSK
jgi:hypothetical protein